jgi:hypothetical protein
LDLARTNATDRYFKSLNEKEYYRNKKRIEDINEISEMYQDKLLVCLGLKDSKR